MNEQLPEEWKSFLAKIAPKNSVMVEDISGNQYKCRTVLPARREIELMDKLGELLELPEAKNQLTAYAGAKRDVAGLLKLARGLLKSTKVQLIVGEAFDIAYPGVVAKAIDAVRADSQSTDLPDKPTAFDVFPISELMGGLLPFAVRTVVGIRDKISESPTNPPPSTT